MKTLLKVIILTAVSYLACALVEKDKLTSNLEIFLPNQDNFSDLQKHNKSHCPQLHHEFADRAGKFYECAILRSEPQFALCRQCINTYQNMSVAYATLSTTKDNTTGQSCLEKFINNDRLNMVYDLSHTAQNIWMNANCDACYVPWNSNSTNSTPALSDDSYTFFNLTANFTACLSNGKKKDNQTLCKLCELNYTNLNNFYEGMKKSSKDSVCFDIESSMNQSRIHWSGDLKCCRDKKSPLITFYLSAGFIFTLTIFFYGSTFVLGRNNLEDSLLITDEMPGPLSVNSSTDPVLSTITNRRTQNSPARVTNITPSFSRNVVGSSQGVPQSSSALSTRNNLNLPSKQGARPKAKQNNIEAARQKKLDLVKPISQAESKPLTTGRLINLSDENIPNLSDVKHVEPANINTPGTDDDQLLT